MDTKLFYIFILLLIKVVSAEISNNSVNNNQVIYNTNLTRCNMYSIFCRVSILVKKELNVEDLTIKSNDEHKFSYKSIELCPFQLETTNTTKLDLGCMLKNNLTKEIIDNYNIYSIKLDANIIGKAKLEISVKDNKQKYEQEVLIMQPMRLIDIFFTIYVWGFAILISLLMGLMLDINTLIKIIKIPIPVGIGLSCQYMIMPLVILFNKLIYSDF